MDKRRICIVGGRFHANVMRHFQDELELIGLTPSNNLITLVAEPTNAYDKNAIKVMYRGNHIGYVSKSHNRGLLKDFKLPLDIRLEVVDDITYDHTGLINTFVIYVNN